MRRLILAALPVIAAALIAGLIPEGWGESALDALPDGMQLYDVASGSMEPTLPKGSTVATRPWRASTVQLPRGAIVVFSTTEGDVMLKRLVAVPGDRVIVDASGSVTVIPAAAAGEPIDLCPAGEYDDIATVDRVLGSGEYFALGDNCWRSMDSRHRLVGIVRADRIIGVAAYLIRDGTTIEPLN